MWTPEDRALVGDFGAGQALSDEQYRLVEPLIPPAKPGGRPRTTDMRRLLDGLFYLLRTGCQWDAIPSEFGSRSTCIRGMSPSFSNLRSSEMNRSARFTSG